MTKVYVIGSLRNPKIPEIANKIREAGFEVFDDWYAAGEKADDAWQAYEDARGHSYAEALAGAAATNVYEFDKRHLDASDAVVLVLPAGKSGHLELGYCLGTGKPGYILLDPEERKLPPDWKWLAGLYEGEGSITVNNTKTSRNLQLSVSSTDKDVIEKLKAVSKVGNVQGPYFRKHANLLKQPEVIKPMYRWAVYKKEDLLYTCRGMFDDLCSRRQEQIMKIIEQMGWEGDFKQSKSPHEFRYDVMYKFADGVFDSQEQLIAKLKHLPLMSQQVVWEVKEACKKYVRN